MTKTNIQLCSLEGPGKGVLALTGIQGPNRLSAPAPVPKTIGNQGNFDNMSKKFKEIRIEKRGHIAEVILARPKKLNAMAPEFFTEIGEAFREIDADKDIRVALLWAEGRMFTAGLDLKSGAGLLMPDSDQKDGDKGNGVAQPSEAKANQRLYRTIRDIQDCFTAIEQCNKPVIAAVHGKCVGGGVDLITACDIRLCTEDAQFAIFETKIAIVADVGTLQRITAIVGKGMAREMAFTGAFVNSKRAERSGLVNSVYADQESMLKAAREMAEEIAGNSPLAVQGAKIVLNYSDEHTVDEGLEYVAQWNSAFLRSGDLVEAVSAFAEKRKPEFKGE